MFDPFAQLYLNNIVTNQLKLNIHNDIHNTCQKDFIIQNMDLTNAQPV